MSNHRVTILEEIISFGTNRKGEEKKLIKAKWNKGTPVYEIRSFLKDGTPGRREGLSKEELLVLRDALNKMEI